MRFARVLDSSIRIGGQCLTHSQLSHSFQKYREVGILEEILETRLKLLDDSKINVQFIPIKDTMFQPKNVVEVVI